VSTITTLFEERAKENIAEWGVQELETLVLAIAEETGEVAQALLQYLHEDGRRQRIIDEAVDLGALCIQLIEAEKVMP
jgi:NTP pyrophosphatase (non-canonical NTP hydrolase)